MFKAKLLASAAARRSVAAVGACALVVATLAIATTGATPAHAASTVGAGYWSTSGSTILDADGNPVRDRKSVV